MRKTNPEPYNARLASLHAVRGEHPCYQVTCDGCGEAPEDGEGRTNLHFTDKYPFDPDWHEWHVVNGLDLCDDCRLSMICGECGNLSGDGSKDRDGMCQQCWDVDQRRPGPGQMALAEVTS